MKPDSIIQSALIFNLYKVTQINNLFNILLNLKEFRKLWRNYIILNILKATGKGWNTMQITDVRIRKIASEGKMKGIVSVTFDNEFVVHDIKVIEGQMGLFIAMPSRKTPDGEFKDIAHPINTEAREKIQTAILDAYKKAVEEEAAEK